MSKISSLRKFLFILLPVSVIIVCVILIYLLVIREEQLFCNSENCLKFSTHFLDETINPCSDFRDYICGKDFDYSIRNFIQEINHIITEPIQINDSNSLVLAKQFYKSCMDTERIEHEGINTILETFKQLGDWPITKRDRWNDYDFNWTNLMLKCRYQGLKFDWFIEFDVNGTFLQINIPQYLRPAGYQRYYDSYRKVINDISIEFGAYREVSAHEVREIINFEKELIHIAMKYRKVSSTKTTIRELISLWPHIPWLSLINQITQKQFNEYDYIAFDILDYLKDLKKLLDKSMKRIQMDYIMWKILETFSKFLPQRAQVKFLLHQQKFIRNTIVKNRREICLNETKIQFPNIAEGVYIRKHINDETIYLITDIFVNIKKIFLKMFDDWRIRQEVENLKIGIGGTEEILNNELLDRKLGLYQFNFRSLNPIQMLKQLKLKQYERKFKQIIENSDIKYSYNKIIRAYDNLTIINNTMTIPANVVQDLFHSQWPMYLNYGTIGNLIAQQFIRHYRSQINRNNARCFDEESLLVVEQLIGMDLAYKAYKSLNNLSDKQATNLKYSVEQRYWIASAKLFCKSNGLDYLSIMPHFLKDFDCKTELFNNEYSNGLKCDVKKLLL